MLTLVVVHAFSQGRKTTRERDLHARKVLVTGGFTPLGLTLLQSLAQRGAHIIALSPEPLESSRTSILVDLLRTTTSNENIFAEYCDLTSPGSIRAFCTKFLTGEDTRIDAIVYAHEYQHVGPFKFFSRWSQASIEAWAEQRESSSLATFLMTTLLLPALLVAPVERDIRIITVVNRFYAAAIAAHIRRAFSPSFTLYTATPPSTSLQSTKAKPQKKHSVFLSEGVRSLRTIILTRHLQRILDSLPHAQVPKTDERTSTVPVVSAKAQRSNIVSVSVSPGISRTDTIAPLLNGDWTLGRSNRSSVGVIFYIILQPILRIFAKSPMSSIQTVLHSLFLPTPFKIVYKPADPNPSTPSSSSNNPKRSPDDDPIEVLKPGALYAECAVVNLDLSKVVIESAPDTSDETKPKSKKEKGKEKEKASGQGLQEEVLEIEDDGELGGEVLGRRVWEAYEDALKAWEKADPSPPPPPSPPHKVETPAPSSAAAS
ncbi:hypothetical protein BDN72DRAFT_841780 [Pluteus cervinus]|uniref:Uncharacterized protein n=1 Tax=Pluteus cervinus TaxID=181527 RepID=A0ACD3AS61_9AGAR|nr:hypothetical protein BDN72DRAFT_841780 [Pluteus cervinus]